MASENFFRDQSNLSRSETTQSLPVREISDLPTLTDVLTAHQVSTEQWGLGGAKELEDLLDELLSGEAQLVEQGGRLVRRIGVARIAVSHIDGEGRTYNLFEDRQVFRDGTVRRRPTSWAVWEKSLAGEAPDVAAVRGLQEELKISGVHPEKQGISVVYEPPMDYPGVPTVVTNHDYTVTLKDVDVSHSFVEQQEKKSTIFSWRDVSGPMTIRAQQLQRCSLDTLECTFISRAAEFHRQMLEHPEVSAGGVFLAETFTGGRIAEALSSFDGSSRYLRGALYSSAEKFWQSRSQSDVPFFQLGESLREDSRSFMFEHHLKGETIFSNCALVNLPYAIDLFVGAETHREVITLAFDPAAQISDAHQIERARLIAGILTLEYAMIENGDSNGSEFKRIDGALSALAHEARAFNRKVWERVQGLLKGEQDSMVIGESFTFGKLARLFGESIAGSSLLHSVYGWYDPEYKIAMGVSDQQITDQLIAEPATVAQGVSGLVRTLVPDATLAVGTTGWANGAGPRKEDQFSVAALAKSSEGEFLSTLRFEVLVSSESPPSFERRELTRELGVTAALLALIDVLNCRTPDRIGAALTSELSEYLERFGRMQRQLGS